MSKVGFIRKELRCPPPGPWGRAGRCALGSLGCRPGFRYVPTCLTEASPRSTGEGRMGGAGPGLLCSRCSEKTVTAGVLFPRICRLHPAQVRSGPARAQWALALCRLLSCGIRGVGQLPEMGDGWRKAGKLRHAQKLPGGTGGCAGQALQG